MRFVYTLLLMLLATPALAAPACKVLKASDVRSMDGSYRVHLSSSWVLIPPEQVRRSAKEKVNPITCGTGKSRLLYIGKYD